MGGKTVIEAEVVCGQEQGDCLTLCREAWTIMCDELQTFSCRHDGEIMKVILGLCCSVDIEWTPVLSQAHC